MLLLVLALLAPPAHAYQRSDDFYTTYAMARHVGIRAEVASKIALTVREAGPVLPGTFDQGLREGNLMKASAGLPSSRREAIRALVKIRAQLPLEALDCERGDKEPNCLASAADLTRSFAPALTDLPKSSFSETEREKLLSALAPAPASLLGRPRAFLGAGDAWTAVDLLGEQDVTEAQGYFDAMYEEKL